jgi:hypothetical protein
METIIFKIPVSVMRVKKSGSRVTGIAEPAAVDYGGKRATPQRVDVARKDWIHASIRRAAL